MLRVSCFISTIFKASRPMTLSLTREFHEKLTRTTKCGLNTHKSNRARKGISEQV